MNDITCYFCAKEFEYNDEDVRTTNDIVEGQYVEFEVVSCPCCEMIVRI
ncbi:hypothetical protein NVP1173O_14 [Vibrio phage 1.173.O._10N.261.55.A11]|nr:hypothetical protein NVP1173O_14 [Vibrio phage 1.173.O._10N.261.55.A11]